MHADAARVVQRVCDDVEFIQRESRILAALLEECDTFCVDGHQI